jgi:hypothetical protein
MKFAFLLFLLAILSPDFASGKPDGSPDACAEKPEHGSPPQTGKSPYDVKKKEKDGKYKISICGKKEKVPSPLRSCWALGINRRNIILRSFISCC